MRGELVELMGEEMIHLDIREAFDRIGSKVLDIHGALEAIVGPVDLHPPAEKHLENARNFVPWDALEPPGSNQPAGPNNGRGWMRPEELAELEALEAELAAELRAQKK